jgi:hypothetical protein
MRTIPGIEIDHEISNPRGLHTHVNVRNARKDAKRRLVEGRDRAESAAERVDYGGEPRVAHLLGNISKEKTKFHLREEVFYN